MTLSAIITPQQKVIYRAARLALGIALGTCVFFCAGCTQNPAPAGQANSSAAPPSTSPATGIPSEKLSLPPGPKGAESTSADLAEIPILGTRSKGTDWPSFLGPTGDSKSSETGLRKNWQTRPPQILWERKLHNSYGMPAISRGRCVIYDRIGNQATAICVESETGRELWTYRHPSTYIDNFGYDNGPRCAPVIDGSRVYLFGAEGMLTCLKLANGEKLWECDTAKKFNVVQNFFGVGSTPLVEGDLLLVHVGGSPPGSAIDDPQRLDLVKGADSAVVAFDKLTGQVKYQFSDELASYASPVTTTLGQRRWGLMFARGGLIGFEPATGKQDFHFPWRADDLFSVNASNPVVVGDLVLISECYGPGTAVLRIKPGGYDVVWRDDPHPRKPKSLQTHWNTPIHHQGYVYGSSGRHTSAELRCVELTTGKVQWSEAGLGRASLLYVEDHFVCLTENGDVLLLATNPQKFSCVATWVPQNAATGQLLLRYPAWAAPIISHGLLYVRGADRLICADVTE
ncbi:MAG: PQQ-binding-like beta-propeller repeat protein [Pirellulales bacterium]|nr:PQQ-binding-like beta-propeller repeat protein [Pirellulales bacterium]